MGLYGTWAERASQDNSLFRLENGAPFVGQFQLGTYLPGISQFLLTCLIDFVQTPCDPAAPMTQSFESDYGQVLQIPLKIPGLTEGLHDLVVLLWLDPYANHGDPEAETRIYRAFDVEAVRASLAVGGNTTPPEITFEELPWPGSVFGLHGLAVSELADPWDQYGGFPYITYLRAYPGQAFDFYLHLFNRQGVRLDYAITAFVDYQQVPILYHGQAHTPLYFSTKAGAWYAVPVQVIAPDKPGHYEFVVMGEAFPQGRIDLDATLYSKYIDFPLHILWPSTRIYLEVSDSS